MRDSQRDWGRLTDRETGVDCQRLTERLGETARDVHSQTRNCTGADLDSSSIIVCRKPTTKTSKIILGSKPGNIISNFHKGLFILQSSSEFRWE